MKKFTMFDVRLFRIAIGVAALFFAAPGFSACSCTFDFATETAVCTGTTCDFCDCSYSCDVDALSCNCGTCPCGGVTCGPTSCLIIMNCVGPAAEAINQTTQLIYANVDTNTQDIALTGMMGLTEGTFADSEEVFVLDETTLFTNEVDITPAWCQ